MLWDLPEPSRVINVSRASAKRCCGVARFLASSARHILPAMAASAVSMRAPATGSNLPNRLYMPSDCCVMLALRCAR